MDKDTEQKIEQLQEIEQKLQAFSIQRQSFEASLIEIEQALSEMKKSADTVYKIAGQVMFVADKLKLEKELSEKKRIFSARIDAISHQEKLLAAERDSITAKISLKLIKIK